MFPSALKTSPLLRAWLRRLDALGVVFQPRHHWRGWSMAAGSIFDTPHGNLAVDADATVLAPGGASWPQLGSDGGWVGAMTEVGIAVTLLRPANCGFIVEWTDSFQKRFEGQPLKRIALSFGGQSVRGEAIITARGLEGGGIYALSAPLREAIAACGEAVGADRPAAGPHRERSGTAPCCATRQAIALDLPAQGRPRSRPPPSACCTRPRSRRLDAIVAAMQPAALSELIKAVPVRLTGVADIARAISTAGGIALDEVDGHFMLKRKPGVFVAGEMLDWEAPTGGYLLQACFATGAAAGRGARWPGSPAAQQTSLGSNHAPQGQDRDRHRRRAGPGEGMGNGRATVMRFAQEGAKVLAVDRDLASAEETVALAARRAASAWPSKPTSPRRRRSRP